MSLNYTEVDAASLEFIEVAEQRDLPNGERLFVEIDDFSIVIFNIADKLFAIEDLCSHDNGPLGDGELEDEFKVACPRHGANFDVRSGQAVSFPAVIDIPAYPVRVVDGMIEVGIPNQKL
jgi:3-phenylpropionate/trans-cinnamate dioxygenase ferredoxin subunit